MLVFRGRPRPMPGQPVKGRRTPCRALKAVRMPKNTCWKALHGTGRPRCRRPHYGLCIGDVTPRELAYEGCGSVKPGFDPLQWNFQRWSRELTGLQWLAQSPTEPLYLVRATRQGITR